MVSHPEAVYFAINTKPYFSKIVLASLPYKNSVNAFAA
ncbi:MAG: hypothetical protein K0R50_4871, partial [Eubacterium sp.]|nr:hypothetical protein [Eubacterium sp.]